MPGRVSLAMRVAMEPEVPCFGDHPPVTTGQQTVGDDLQACQPRVLEAPSCRLVQASGHTTATLYICQGRSLARGEALEAQGPAPLPPQARQKQCLQSLRLYRRRCLHPPLQCQTSALLHNLPTASLAALPAPCRLGQPNPRIWQAGQPPPQSTHPGSKQKAAIPPGRHNKHTHMGG